MQSSSNNPISTPADEWSQSTLAALNSSSAAAAAEEGIIGVGGSSASPSLKNLSGREQAAAQLAAKLASASAGGQGQGQEMMTVDEQLAREQPVIPTRHADAHAQAQPPSAAIAIAEIPILVETLPPASSTTSGRQPEPALYAVTDHPSQGLHSTASGIPHTSPISASAQTSGFTEPISAGGQQQGQGQGQEALLVAVPITTVVPGHHAQQKTVEDLLASSAPAVPASLGARGTELPSHNPFNSEHTPGYMDVQPRTMTGGPGGAVQGGMTPGGMTPGMELPGGWGAVLKTQGAAALPHTESTLSQDVTTALHEVGRTAFGLLPESLVDKLSYHHQPASSATASAPLLPSSGDVKETAANVGHTLVGGTINAGSALGQGAATAGQQVAGGAIVAGQAVGETAATVGSHVVGGAIVAGQSAADLGAQAASGALNLGSAVGQGVVDAGSAVVGGAVNATTAVGQTAANVGSSLVDGTVNAGAAVRDTTAGAVGGVVGGVESLVEQAREALGHMHLPGFGAIVGGGGGGGTQEQQREAGVQSVTASRAPVTTTTSVQQGDTVIDHAKNMASELINASQSKAEEAYNAVRQTVTPASTNTTTTGTRGVQQEEAAGGWRGTLEGLGERVVTSVADFGGHSTNPSAHAANKDVVMETRNVSLPSEETTGAHPGEHSAGVGALPGSKFATRVAVLPEERELAHEGSAGKSDQRDIVGGSSSALPAGQGQSHEGYAPSGPAMALGGATTSSHSHHHHSEAEGTQHRSVTEIIKDGANKHSSSTSTATDSSKSATGPSATVIASSSSGEQRHEGYAPSGPAVDLGSSGSTATPSYLEDAAHPSQAKKAALGGQYELGGLSSAGGSGTSGVKDSSRIADQDKGLRSGVTASEKKVEVLASSGARQGELGSSAARQGESALYGDRHAESMSSGARQSDSTSYGNSQVRPTSSGAPLDASSSVGASQPITTSATTTTSTTHTNYGSGPLYDLAPPLGVIVGATPLVGSHIQTDRSTHEPILPGNIPAALPKEPIAVFHPKDSGLASIGDSGANTPGSTLESEQTHGTHGTAASALPLDAARFQAPKADRTDSYASTTAIMHGKLGNTHHEQDTTSTLKDTTASSSAGSNLKAVAEKELPKTPASVGHSAPTSHSTSTNTATRAPGSEAGAVGGIASSGLASSRLASSGHASSGLASSGSASSGMTSSAQHASTPAAATASSVIGKGKDMTTANSEPHHTVKEEFASVGHGTLDKPASSVAAKQAPKTDSSATPGQGRPVAAASSPTSATSGADYTPSAHQRTGSTESGGSKRSFLDKIKSKLHHNKH
ncbi:hypothetical protein QFC21_001939 [Naganishia friedmannii]|uniref:Uncharacterized protein n=1 Tax=Naganishia friedmannii TaxID=89922 RepID=A0ACC2VZN0_9TREE|nr:hypothetical protein QFC21_001939 [Naganishia friedmannii]